MTPLQQHPHITQHIVVSITQFNKTSSSASILSLALKASPTVKLFFIFLSMLLSVPGDHICYFLSENHVRSGYKDPDTTTQL